VADYSGALTNVGRIAIVVSRYHERITSKLLSGARACCEQAGIGADDVDVFWAPGAFELGAVAAAVAKTEGYAAIVALGVVVRGETPHFDYVAGAATTALGRLAAERGLPVGFGLLTVDTMEQAVARAGGDLGNKGFEAAEAAIRTADVIGRFKGF
jgi:6,7-dimethyl-8-ribityllumazine synthase